MTLDQIVGNLKALANPDNVAGMARYGISTEAVPRGPHTRPAEDGRGNRPPPRPG